MSEHHWLKIRGGRWLCLACGIEVYGDAERQQLAFTCDTRANKPHVPLGTRP